MLHVRFGCRHVHELSVLLIIFPMLLFSRSMWIRAAALPRYRMRRLLTVQKFGSPGTTTVTAVSL